MQKEASIARLLEGLPIPVPRILLADESHSLVSIGKLTAPMELDKAVEFAAAQPLAMTIAHIRRGRFLPFHHRDPFDRLLIAQVIEEGLTIVTRDRIVAAYGVPVLTA